jgi:ATPase subunit of ABC transporter with duplicated ATPase domains
LNGHQKPDSGTFDWGITTNQAYLPVDNHSFFENDLTFVDWLRQWAKTEEERRSKHPRLFGQDDFLAKRRLKLPAYCRVVKKCVACYPA